MFHHILVPLDNAERSKIAVRVARRLARRADARIILLHVEPEVALTSEAVRAYTTLHATADRLRAEHLRAQAYMRYGLPEETIPEIAQEVRADLLVMVPHERDRFEVLFNPRMTEHMVTHGLVPVLIWPEHAPEKAPADLLQDTSAAVLVPLDQSEQSERALPLAAEMAQLYQRPIILVSVVPPSSLITQHPVAATTMLKVQEEEKIEARHYLSLQAERLREQISVPVETRLLMGDPGAEILRVATVDHAGLIVMTTHGRTGISRAVAGSVANHVIRHAEVPLLVLPSHVPLEAENALWVR